MVDEGEWTTYRDEGNLSANKLDFENQDRCGVVLNRIPILVPKVTALTHRVRPPSLGRGHVMLSVGDQHQKGFARKGNGSPAYITDLGTVCLAPGRTPPLPKTKEPPPHPHR